MSMNLQGMYLQIHITCANGRWSSVKWSKICKIASVYNCFIIISKKNSTTRLNPPTLKFVCHWYHECGDHGAKAPNLRFFIDFNLIYFFKCSSWIPSKARIIRTKFGPNENVKCKNIDNTAKSRIIPSAKRFFRLTSNPIFGELWNQIEFQGPSTFISGWKLRLFFRTLTLKFDLKVKAQKNRIWDQTRKKRFLHFDFV